MSTSEGGPLLVTGADGFVGTHLCDRALERGLEVVSVGRSGEMRRVDVRDGHAVGRLVADLRPAAVIHLASPPAHQVGTWDGLAEALQGAGNVIAAVDRATPGTPVLVPGSAAQYGMGGPGRLTEESPTVPVSLYGAVKCICEAAALSDPLRGKARVIWTRSFNHVGPGQSRAAPVASWAAQAAAAERAGGGTIRTGSLDHVRDFLDVRDVADAYLDLVASDAAGVVNVCSGKGVALAEIVEMFVSLSRVEVRIERDPALLRTPDPPRIVGEPARLEALTGFKPKYDLARSLRDVLDEWRHYGNQQSSPVKGGV